MVQCDLQVGRIEVKKKKIRINQCMDYISIDTYTELIIAIFFRINVCVCVRMCSAWCMEFVSVIVNVWVRTVRMIRSLRIVFFSEYVHSNIFDWFRGLFFLLLSNNLLLNTIQ